MGCNITFVFLPPLLKESYIRIYKKLPSSSDVIGFYFCVFLIILIILCNIYILVEIIEIHKCTENVKGNLLEVELEIEQCVEELHKFELRLNSKVEAIETLRINQYNWNL